MTLILAFGNKGMSLDVRKKGATSVKDTNFVATIVPKGLKK